MAGGPEQQRSLSLLLYFCEHALGQGQSCVSKALTDAGATKRNSGKNDWQCIVAADCQQLWEAARNSAAAWVMQTP